MQHQTGIGRPHKLNHPMEGIWKSIRQRQRKVNIATSQMGHALREAACKAGSSWTLTAPQAETHPGIGHPLKPNQPMEGLWLSIERRQRSFQKLHPPVDGHQWHRWHRWPIWRGVWCISKRKKSRLFRPIRTVKGLWHTARGYAANNWVME